MPHKNKVEQQSYWQKYYQENKNKILQKNRKWAKGETVSDSRKRSRVKIQKFVADQKQPCIHCGWFEHPCGIDWHHVDPSTKSFELSRASQHGIAKVTDEIARCVCLCKNCH